MTPPARSSVVNSLRGLSAVAALASFFTGLVVLVGWALDVDALKSVAPGLSAMKPNTALGFILAGASLWLLRRERAGGGGRLAVARILAFAVAALGLLTLSQYLWGWDLGLDQLFFHEAVGGAQMPPPGRMAPTSAASFALVGFALLLLDVPRGAFAQLPAMAVGLLSLIALTGYAYDVSALYRFGPYSSVAIHTACVFALLSLGLLAVRPERGFMAAIASRQPGGALARRMLLPAVLIPLGLGWFYLQSERLGLFETELGLALFATSNIVLFVVLVGWTARSLDRADMERSRTEETLRRREARMKSLLDAALDAVIGMDSQGRVVSWNERATAMFGWPRQQAIGRTVAELLIPPRFHAAHRQGLARFLATGEGSVLDRRVELSAVRRDGSEFPVELTITALEEGGELFFNAFIEDITERKQAAEAENRARESEEQARLALEANRLKSGFLANMSHELRTPLNAILGFSELLQDGGAGPMTSQQEEYLGDIVKSSRYLLQLINDLLDLARIEAGKVKFQPEPVHLATAVMEAQLNLRALAERKRIRFETDADPALGLVLLDPHRLRQVLFNYLSNALKFTPDEGCVTVRIRAEGERYFRLAVEDTGLGISPEELGLLFREFHQLEAGAARTHAGTGLGLALTKRLVEAQGGWVGAESTPGKGSVFFAVLPRVAVVP